AAEIARAVHDRREEIGREHEREIVGEFHDGGVVGGGRADEHARIGEQRQQETGRVFGGTTGSLGQLRESDGFADHVAGSNYRKFRHHFWFGWNGFLKTVTSHVFPS